VAIIARDQLGAVGGLNGQAFMLAVNRASEICIGIVCAGIVLALTDLGGARRRLATLFAAISAEIGVRFTGTLVTAGAEFEGTQTVRRELVRRVILLDPVIDEALGESAQLRYHSPVLQNALDGLLDALTGWRTAAVLLARAPDQRAREEAAAVMARVPEELRLKPEQDEATRWIADPARLLQVCGEVIYEGGRFTRVDRDAALRELHRSLQCPLAEDELERRQLSKALLPHVRRFYSGYFDPETHLPHYRTSSRR
jgi:hypothetical protein